MVSVTADTFTTLLDTPDDFEDATAEEIIDLAIHAINNIASTELPNMTGTAGSKTVTLQSAEVWPVLLASRAIYNGFYKGLDVVSVGGLSVSIPDVISNSVVMMEIEKAAKNLKELDVSYG